MAVHKAQTFFADDFIQSRMVLDLVSRNTVFGILGASKHNFVFGTQTCV